MKGCIKTWQSNSLSFCQVLVDRFNWADSRDQKQLFELFAEWILSFQSHKIWCQYRVDQRFGLQSFILHPQWSFCSYYCTDSLFIASNHMFQKWFNFDSDWKRYYTVVGKCMGNKLYSGILEITRIIFKS